MKPIKFSRIFSDYRIPVFTLLAFATLAHTSEAATTLLDDHFDNGVVATGGTGSVNGGFTVVELGGTAGNSTSESGTLLTHNNTGTNDNSGIISVSSFDPTAYTSITATWVVTSYTAASSNGFSLFLSSANSGITVPSVQFLFESQQDATFDLIANDGTTGAQTLLDDAISTAESRNGFTLTATFDATGITTSVTGLPTLATGFHAYAGGQTYASLFDSTTYVGVRTQALGATDASFVLDRITVTAIPEPNGTALIAGAFGLALMMRRRQC